MFDKQAQEILVVELSCPWVTNRIKKDEEKTTKYEQVREELNPISPGLFGVPGPGAVGLQKPPSINPKVMKLGG